MKNDGPALATNACTNSLKVLITWMNRAAYHRRERFVESLERGEQTLGSFFRGIGQLPLACRGLHFKRSPSTCTSDTISEPAISQPALLPVILIPLQLRRRCTPPSPWRLAAPSLDGQSVPFVVCCPVALYRPRNPRASPTPSGTSSRRPIDNSHPIRLSIAWCSTYENRRVDITLFPHHIPSKHSSPIGLYDLLPRS